MKLQSKHYITGFIIGIFAVAYSCSNKLDLYPEDKLTDAAYWLNATHVRDACNYLYSFLPEMSTNWSHADYADDAVSSSGFNSISDGSRLAPGTDNDWNNNYKLIRNCNNILEKSAGLTDTESVRFQGEAYFFRAWANFELVKRFGNIPLILRTYDVSDTLNTAHRTSRETVLDAAYSDLDKAIASLPDAGKLTSAEYGRIPSGAALALKARIGLFEGTRCKFFGTGNAQKHLNIAISSCETLINSGIYSLYYYQNKPGSNTYYNIFTYAGEGRANKENILVRLYGEKKENNISSHYTVGYLQGSACPTRALADAYRYIDGLPINKSPYYKPQTNTLTEFENRDPRMDATIFNKNYVYLGSNWVPGFIFWPTGYGYRKYFVPDDYKQAVSFEDNILIRYAEVLLTYAEAKYELNEIISDSDLDLSVNLLRDRAGIAHLTNSFVTANGLNMRTELRTERRVELAMECGHRYWDLIRWKEAENELPKSILGTKLFPKEHSGTASIKINQDSIVVVQDASKRSFDTARDYLWPIPTKELGLNPNLGQNPNW